MNNLEGGSVSDILNSSIRPNQSFANTRVILKSWLKENNRMAKLEIYSSIYFYFYFVIFWERNKWEGHHREN